jgi:hypothetical protein
MEGEGGQGGVEFRELRHDPTVEELLELWCTLTRHAGATCGEWGK